MTMERIAVHVIWLPVLLLTACTGRGATDAEIDEFHRAKSLFEEAQRAAESDPETASAKFAEAGSIYRGLTSGGLVNGELFYNAGVAYHFAGRKGEAMLSYMLAERLIPKNLDLQGNLNRLKKDVADRGFEIKTESSAWGAIFFWHRGLEFKLKVFGFLAALIVTIAMIVAGRMLSARIWTRFAAVPGAIGLLLAGSAVIELAGSSGSIGAIAEEGVIARQSAGETYESYFKHSDGEPAEAPVGAPFEVIGAQDDWIHIRFLGNEDDAWVPASGVVTSPLPSLLAQ